MKNLKKIARKIADSRNSEVVDQILRRIHERKWLYQGFITQKCKKINCDCSYCRLLNDYTRLKISLKRLKNKKLEIYSPEDLLVDERVQSLERFVQEAKLKYIKSAKKVNIYKSIESEKWLLEEDGTLTVVSQAPRGIHQMLNERAHFSFSIFA